VSSVISTISVAVKI